jgi:hypothetical protein
MSEGAQPGGRGVAGGGAPVHKIEVIHEEGAVEAFLSDALNALPLRLSHNFGRVFPACPCCCPSGHGLLSGAHSRAQSIVPNAV